MIPDRKGFKCKAVADGDVMHPAAEKRPGRKRRPVIDRIRARVIIDAETGCHNWTGAKNAKGYGRIKIPQGPLTTTHRAMYIETIGPVPDGLVLDHLCRNPGCCNPLHLEAVTILENTRRGRSGEKDRIKTHCPQGHPYSQTNTGRTIAGHRYCRICKTERSAARKHLDTGAHCSQAGSHTGGLTLLERELLEALRAIVKPNGYDVGGKDGLNLERARAAIAKAEATATEAQHAGQWRTIESAPKAESNSEAPICVLLAWFNITEDRRKVYCVGEGYWHPTNERSDDDGAWWWANTTPGDYYDDQISECITGHITHWQPLPSPPPADAEGHQS